jgi:hypothetical protein
MLVGEICLKSRAVVSSRELGSAGLAAQVMDRDERALSSEGRNDGGPDTARAAGYEYAFAVEARFHDARR